MKALGIIFSNIHDDKLPELTAHRTISSVPFAGRFRLIDFVLSNMVHGNINKVGIVTKYNYQSLMDHIGGGKHWDLSRKNGGIMVLPPFGDAQNSKIYSSRFEALLNIGQFLTRSDEDYVVMSDCDIVSSVDFNDVLQYHMDKRADITVIYRKAAVDGTVDTATLETNGDNRVCAVNNQSRQTGEKKIYINMLILNRSFLLNLLEHSTELGYKSFSKDVLAKGCRDYKIYAYEYTGYFAWIDSLANYYAHSMELLDKDKRDSLFYSGGANILTKVRDSAPCRIETGARVANSIIADGCVIEGTVTNSILFRGVRVAKNAVIKDSIVFQDTSISTNSRLNCVIADKQVRILEGRELSGHCTHPYFIAKNSVI